MDIIFCSRYESMIFQNNKLFFKCRCGHIEVLDSQEKSQENIMEG
jgi:hypothetical protein